MNIFAGRVIFDHLAKTAGQAVNNALRTRLGAGCVTENLIGEHRSLIQKYGGNYSIISGHIHFEARRKGLDPRYDYVTLFRNPVERAVSWLYFITNNYTTEDLPGLHESAQLFLDSEGEHANPTLIESISNYYTRHFYSVIGDPNKDDKILEAALGVLGEYAVVGIYEEMPAFLGVLSDFLGLDPWLKLEKINLTKNRIGFEKCPPKLLSKIKELNQLDLEFYEGAKELVHHRKINNKDKKTVSEKPLVSYDRILNPKLEVDEFKLISAVALNPKVNTGDCVEFVVDFSIATCIELLEAGIHIFDSFGEWAFGCNSNMLGGSLQKIAPGTYRNTYKVTANLPAGIYKAGFAFADTGSGKHRELAWFENTVAFEVVVNHVTPGIGYASLPLQLESMKLSKEIFASNEEIYHCGGDLLSNIVGSKTNQGIFSDGREGFLLYGPYTKMAAGRYEIRFIGEISGSTEGVWVDCAAREVRALGDNSQVKKLAGRQVETSSPGLPLATLTVDIKNDVEDFETRFYVNSEASVHLRYVVIKKLDISIKTHEEKLDKPPNTFVQFTIHNPTSRHWTSEGENPLQVACHWLDETWNMVQFDAQRFPLPAEGISPQETREVEIQVTSPKKPGRYHLMVTLVQTLDGKEKWLHETDEFTPQIFDREVEE